MGLHFCTVLLRLYPFSERSVPKNLFHVYPSPCVKSHSGVHRHISTQLSHLFQQVYMSGLASTSFNAKQYFMYWKFQITILSYGYQVGNFAMKRFGGGG